jgi:hypothetical protein
MSTLITRWGLSIPQAAAIASNLQGESGLFAGAFNPEGGGTGARGLGQWRGARTANFRARFGVTPDQATVDQQLEFMMTDPYERGLLNRSLNGPGGANELGQRFSRIYEGHGKLAEDIRRGGAAAQLASAYGGTNGNGIGQQVNIQTVNVTANNPQEFVGGITRLTPAQNYNSAVR